MFSKLYTQRLVRRERRLQSELNRRTDGPGTEQEFDALRAELERVWAALERRGITSHIAQD